MVEVSNRILPLVILLIVAARHVVEPLLVVQIPADGLFDTLLELQRGFPAELFLQLRRVDGIAQVVTSTVGNEGDEVHILAFLTTQQAVDGVDDHLDDVDVLPLVETTDVVGLGNQALVEDEVDGTGVVLDEQPVAHVLALAIHGQRLAVADVVDEQRNQLLRELIGAVVVRAVGDDDGHAVCIVISTNKVVARSFSGRIW